MAQRKDHSSNAEHTLPDSGWNIDPYTTIGHIQIAQLAEVLEVNCASEPFLLWIIQEALETPLPPKWQLRVVKRSKDEDNEAKERDRNNSTYSEFDYSKYMQEKGGTNGNDAEASFILEVFYIDLDSGEETDVHPALGYFLELITFERQFLSVNPPTKDPRDVWLHFHDIESIDVTADEWDKTDKRAVKKYLNKAKLDEKEGKEEEVYISSSPAAKKKEKLSIDDDDASSSDDDASTTSESESESSAASIVSEETSSQNESSGYYYNFAHACARVTAPSPFLGMVLEYTLARDKQSVLEIKQQVDQAMPSPGMYKKRVGTKTKVDVLDSLTFTSWWNEVGIDDKKCVARRHFTIQYFFDNGNFQVVQQGASKVFTLSHINGRSGPLACWDLYIGATINVLGRRVTLMNADRPTVCWLEYHEKRLTEVVNKLNTELVKYDVDLRKPSVQAQMKVQKAHSGKAFSHGQASLFALRHDVKFLHDRMCKFRPRLAAKLVAPELAV